MANKIVEEKLEVDEVISENEVAVIYDIASYPSDLTLSVIYEMWSNKDIEIPEFQRNFVWDIEQSSLLIESFLLGLPIPQVFFFIDDNNKNLVIDGQQRILSVVFYLDGYFGAENLQKNRKVFHLTGLDKRSPYYNRKFSELDESSQRKLKSAVLRAINIRQLSPKGEKTSIYHIFERLNTGGTPLTPQEIRNCVFRGGLVESLRELNKDVNWRKIMGKTTFDKHQKDVELILRIFALVNTWEKYEKPMKEYLNKFMEKEKSGLSEKVKSFISGFSKTAEIISTRIGPKPFHVRGPINTSALDSVFCTLLSNLNKIPGDLKARYERLLLDDTFQESISSGTTDDLVLKKRFEKVKEILIG